MSVRGTWSLRSFVVGFSDNRTPVFPFGDDAIGLLIYSEDGSMSASLSPRQRPNLTIPRLEAARLATADEKETAFDSFVSYSGRYRVDGDEVVHSVELALVPNIVGTELRRRFRLDGEVLVLSYEITPSSGVSRNIELVWERR